MGAEPQHPGPCTPRGDGPAIQSPHAACPAAAERLPVRLQGTTLTCQKPPPPGDTFLLLGPKLPLGTTSLECDSEEALP